MLPLSLVKPFEEILANHLQKTGLITETKLIGGGSINDACRIHYEGHYFFAKWNRASAFPGMFDDEADGLEKLRVSGSLKTPELIGLGSSGNFSFIVLEYISPARPSTNFWASFGRALAQQHRQSHSMFGYSRNNYIGSLRQTNNFHPDWPTFFTHERLIPQLELARQKKYLPATLFRKFDILISRLSKLIPDEAPSLLHGDLWSGNFLCSGNQQAVLIDPAVYFGFREMDIAMTMLFGGFHEGFYHAYNEAFPLEKGWQDRTHLCNLYPLLVHVNLFGGGYLSQLEKTVSMFI